MQNYGATEMAASWRTVRNNTIQIAEELPADQYAYRATPDSMSAGQMLAHMATATHWMEQAHFVERKMAITGQDFGRYFGEIGAMTAALGTKDEIIAALRSRGESFATALAAVTEAQLDEMVELPGATKSRCEVLLGAKEHEMHHRAQLMVLQRLLGIVPHLTRARQARPTT